MFQGMHDFASNTRNIDSNLGVYIFINLSVDV